jgi:hypothetical protein
MRRTILLTVAAWLAVAAPAGAQGISSATPNLAGKGSRLHFEVDATLPPVGGRVPSGLSMAAPSGFVFNPAAVAKRCTQTQANLNECPPKSRIGSGALLLEVRMPEGTRDVSVSLDLFLQSNSKVLAIAFLAGARVVPGVIDSSNGLALRFDSLPSPPAFANVTYALKRVMLNVGTTRRVKRKQRQVRIDLIRNPTECATGTWESSLTLTFPDATNTVLGAPTTCSPA